MHDPIISNRSARLRKHADFERVYRESRKHFSPLISYFFIERPSQICAGPRVGFTVGRAFGKAVRRNRLKRRLREAVRSNLGGLTREVDVVLHPRQRLAAASFVSLRQEVLAIFTHIERAVPQRTRAGAPTEAGR